MDPETAASIALAGCYAIACVAKSRTLRTFDVYLRPLLGKNSRATAVATVTCEALLAAALAASAAFSTPRPAAIASSLFLIAATSVYGLLLASGQSGACRCFGGNLPEKENDALLGPPVLALRNYGLVAVSVYAAGGSTGLTIGAGAIVPMLVCAGLVVSIMRERRFLTMKVHPRVVEHAPAMSRLQAQTWWIGGEPRPL